MHLVSLHDRDVIEAALRRDPEVHLYELGDLDDFFWPHTTWYGLEDRGVVRAVALVYAGGEVPVVVALAREGQTWTVTALLERMRAILPRRFYAHLAVGAVRALGPSFTVEPGGRHERLILRDVRRVEDVDVSRAVALGPPDLTEIVELYAAAYPATWFDARMLETRTYFGVRERDLLVSIAGVHVVSRRHRVAALGNVATLPEHRGRGLARVAVAATCRALAGEVDHLGLNVDASNEGGLRLYRTLGFERAMSYEEVRVS